MRDRRNLGALPGIIVHGARFRKRGRHRQSAYAHRRDAENAEIIEMIAVEARL
jgi:hypothetical protein